MENRKAKYVFIIVMLICVIGAAGSIYSYWREKASQEKSHMTEETEVPENLAGEWTEDEIAAVEEILRKRYGEDIERVSVSVEYWEGAIGDKVSAVTFQVPSIRTAGENFYFQVKSTPEFFDNFPFQLMKSDALRFWNGKKRLFGLYSPDDGAMYEADADRWDTGSYPGETDQLYVLCYEEGDVDACAADIADWLMYAALDERYFLENEMSRGEESDPFKNIWIYTWKSQYQINIEKAVNKIKDGSWEEVQREIAGTIIDLDSKYHIWETEPAVDVTESGAGSQSDAGNSDNLEGTASQGGENGLQQQEEQIRQWTSKDYEIECELEDGRIRYRMVVMDAAAGSRWYGLVKSKDRGLSWQVVSDSPFAGDMGQGIDFTFLNEELGFATLAHNGGDEADLYITENGGERYERVVIQGLDVTLDDGYLYNPYDFPRMPYEKDGKLYVLCGQGADGDYNGGDAAGMALYESTDGGHTFVYIGISKGEED